MSEAQSNSASNFLADMFGASTSSPVYISSLPNGDATAGEPGERRLMTREGARIEAFLRKWDRRGRALYFCTATVRAGATTRSKETIAELNGLYADIDFRSVLDTPEEVERKLAQVRLLPSKVVNSGNGLHAYWVLHEAIPATADNVAHLENLLHLLADHLGGDPACCEASRLLRLPGSHNSKDGAWAEVRVVADRALRYDPDELEEWLTEVSPFIHRKPKEGNGAAGADNPWLAVATRFGLKPPIDVEQRLAAMQFQGAGDAAIHPTQLAVSASLLTQGASIDEVVEALLEATRIAAGRFGERWNWQREEQVLRKMCESWLAKHPEIKAQAEPGPQPEPQPDPQPQAAQATSDGTAKVRKSKRKAGPYTLALAVADGVVETLRREGHELLLTGGELYVYGEGVWRAADAGWEQRLRVLVQEGAETLGLGGDAKLLAAAWKRLMEHPALYRPHIDWDALGKVALANGVLDLHTCEFTSWRPEHFLRRKLEVAYEPSAAAPELERFLAQLLADRDAATSKALTELLQEFAGATLCPRLLHREQRRALFLVGPSRTGKTELARIFTRLVGEPIASPSVGQISETFGLQAFCGVNAWIRDDAVNEGDHLDPQRFKTIVTGEAIDIRRMYKCNLRTELAIPVVLTANSLPASRDASDAVFNRSLVVDLSNVIDERAAVTIRRKLGVQPGTRLADWLFDREGPGILNWALAGLARLLERGEYEIPAEVGAAIQRFKDESNQVAEFARTMLEQSADTKINRADLICAFHGWLKEEVGDAAKLHGARWLMPKLRAACPWATLRPIMGVRYFCGVKLTDEALKYWFAQASTAEQTGRGQKGASALAKDVNQAWSPRDGGENE